MQLLISKLLIQQLEEGLSSAESKNPKPIALTELKSAAGAGYESCKDLLLLIGFKTEETGDDQVTFSKDGTVGLLYCCTAVAEALVGEF